MAKRSQIFRYKAKMENLTKLISFYVLPIEPKVWQSGHSTPLEVAMTARIEDIPLDYPVTTKLSKRDYHSLLNRVRRERTNQTELLRRALREYLSMEKTAS